MTGQKTPLIYKIYHFLADRPVVIVALVATGILLMVQYRLDQIIAGDSLGSIYLQLAFSKNDFELILASWGSAGINKYVNTLWIDYLFALCAAFLLASAAAHFERRHQTGLPEKRHLLLLLLPFCYMVAEFLENTLHLIIITGSKGTDNIIIISSIISFTKMALLMISVGWVLRCYREFRKTQKEEQ